MKGLLYNYVQIYHNLNNNSKKLIKKLLVTICFEEITVLNKNLIP